MPRYIQTKVSLTGTTCGLCHQDIQPGQLYIPQPLDGPPCDAHIYCANDWPRIQRLIDNWRGDPCWNLYQTEGFERYEPYLRQVQKHWEDKWNQEHAQVKVDVYALYADQQITWWARWETEHGYINLVHAGSKPAILRTATQALAIEGRVPVFQITKEQEECDGLYPQLIASLHDLASYVERTYVPRNKLATNTLVDLLLEITRINKQFEDEP